MWEKMIFIILLLLCLTFCVCAGTFVVNVTQTSSQAEENQNITLEWKFTSKPGSSLDSLFITCELLTEHKNPWVYYLYEGVEVSECQDEQFAGRVQCDEDDLREGRLRLHVSRLRTEDSGTYKCKVNTGYGSGSGICSLNVTATRDRPEPETPNATSQPEPESRGRIGLYCGLGVLGLTAAALLGVRFCLFRHFQKERHRDQKSVIGFQSTASLTQGHDS